MRFIEHWLASLAHPFCIGLVVLVAYANSLGNGFVFDDSAYLASSMVRDFAVGEIFAVNWLGLEIYRPLALLSLSCDFLLFETNPLGFHLTSLFLHLLNSLLFYALARDVLRQDRAALWAALVYASHPIQTEVVGWISSRGDLLASLFFLGAYLAHQRDFHSAGWRWRLSAWVLFGAAVLAKETAVILPVVLVLHAHYLGRPAGGLVLTLSAWLRRHWGYGVVLSAVLLLRFLAMSDSAALEGPVSTNFLASLGAWQRIGTIVAILPRYLLLLVVPQGLSADYSYASIPSVVSLFDPWFVAGLASVAVLVVLAKLSRFSAFVVGFFWLCLLPVSNLFVLAPSGMAERYLHLAMLPIALAFGAGIRRWLSGLPGTLRLAQVVIGVVVVSFSVSTFDRNRDWMSDFTLFSAVVDRYPNNARAHENLGFVHYQSGDFTRALHHYQRAAAIQPERFRAHFNLGLLYSQVRRYDAAVVSLKRALALNPNHVETHFNIGLVYQKAGRYPEAIGHYLATLELDSGHQKGRYNLGRAYERVGRPEAAIDQYRALTVLNPDATKAYYRLGELYHRSDLYAEMAVAWSTLLRLDPRHGQGERIRRILKQVSRTVPEKLAE